MVFKIIINRFVMMGMFIFFVSIVSPVYSGVRYPTLSSNEEVMKILEKQCSDMSKYKIWKKGKTNSGLKCLKECPNKNFDEGLLNSTKFKEDLLKTNGLSEVLKNSPDLNKISLVRDCLQNCVSNYCVSKSAR